MTDKQDPSPVELFKALAEAKVASKAAYVACEESKLKYHQAAEREESAEQATKDKVAVGRNVPRRIIPIDASRVGIVQYHNNDSSIAPYVTVTIEPLEQVP